MFESVNKKVVRVTVTPHDAVLARRGSMLGYDGQVEFRPVSGSGGMGGRLGSMMAGESNSMMTAQGNGRILYGYRGLHVDVVNLNAETFTAEADRLLVHSANLQTSVEFLGQGGMRAAVAGAMTGQGLFTSKVHGTGQIAVLSHGGMFPLHLNGNSVGVDPQAYVGHVGQLQVDLKAKAGFKDMIGRGSGEAFQLQVSGHGTVFVQASEEKF